MPGDASLRGPHAVLQVAIGWTNSHLHQFKGRRNLFIPTQRLNYSAESRGRPGNPRKRTRRRSGKSPRNEQDTFGYEYDSGDSWHHEITVDKNPESRFGSPAWRCASTAPAPVRRRIAAARGGTTTCSRFSEIRNREHDCMKEWLGRPPDAEAFDPEKVNPWLQKLKWPRVTEAQVRKTSWRRDDYDE